MHLSGLVECLLCAHETNASYLRFFVESGHSSKSGEWPVWATSGLWRVTGIKQPIWRPDTDSKSYKFPFSDCSSRPAEPTGFRAASRWKLKYVYENGSSPLAIRRLSRTVIASQQRTGKLHLNTRGEMLAYL